MKARYTVHDILLCTSLILCREEYILSVVASTDLIVLQFSNKDEFNKWFTFLYSAAATMSPSFGLSDPQSALLQCALRGDTVRLTKLLTSGSIPASILFTGSNGITPLLGRFLHDAFNSLVPTCPFCGSRGS